MQSYWIIFTDGSGACCDGLSALDAMNIAEFFTTKKVAPKPDIEKPDRYNAEHWQVDRLPYPSAPIIWQFTHPVRGQMPNFCFTPERCKGRGACPRNPSCTS